MELPWLPITKRSTLAVNIIAFICVNRKLKLLCYPLNIILFSFFTLKTRRDIWQNCAIESEVLKLFL